MMIAVMIMSGSAIQAKGLGIIVELLGDELIAYCKSLTHSVPNAVELEGVIARWDVHRNSHRDKFCARWQRTPGNPG